MENSNSKKVQSFKETAGELIVNLEQMNSIMYEFLRRDHEGDPTFTKENRRLILEGAITKIKNLDEDEKSLVKNLPGNYKDRNVLFGACVQDRVLANEAYGKDFTYAASLIKEAANWLTENPPGTPKYKEECRKAAVARLYAAHVCIRSWIGKVNAIVGR